MSDDEKATGSELVKRLAEVPAEEQAALLLDLLQNNPGGLDDVITNRQWTRGQKPGLNSGWPVNPGTDHRTESTERGRRST